jgi:DNA-directed RNA polymerase specialized sigma24 family protein
MKSDNHAGSVTIWIDGIKEGEDSAAQYAIVNRYWAKLEALARKYLRDKYPLGGIHDENDALNRAFDTLFRRAKANRFPELNDRDDLWRLMVAITIRKVQKGIRADRSRKRGGGDVVTLGELASVDDLRDSLIVDAEPSPEDAIGAVEEINRLLNKLANNNLRTIALLKWEGLTDEEIAIRLNRNRRWVVRQKALIRQAWIDELS